MPGPLIGLSQTPIELRGPAPTRHPAITQLDAGWARASRDAGRRTATSRAGPRSRAGRPAAPEPPLAGLRVLNLGTIIAGPYSSTMLGELGAEVWKIERPPHGDEFRTSHGGRGGAGFTVYNRDQRSLLLNLGAEPGAGVFRDLVRSADVVVDNYRVGVVDRLGIDYDHLAEVNPLITTVSISAFGEAGALRERPGFDPVVQAMSGIMRAQGGPDEASSPVFLTVPINDVLAGALGALGACAALFSRGRIGRGQRVTVTLCGSSCLLQSPWLVRVPGVTPAGPAGGRDFAGPGPLDRLYQGADGWVRLERAVPRSPRPRVTPAALRRRAGAGRPHGAAGGELRRGRRGGRGRAGRRHRGPRRDAARGRDRAPRGRGRHPGRARPPGPGTARGRRQLLRHGLLSVIERDEAGVSRTLPGRWLEMPGLVREPPGPAPAAAGQDGDEILAEAGLKPADEQPSPA